MHSVETKQVFAKLTEPSSRPVLRIESLTKRFGRSTVVDQLSLNGMLALWRPAATN